MAQRGIELNLGPRQAPDKLGPSIAMLPSADAAMVAFAEVTSFVRYYAHEAGDDALPKLFQEIRSGKEPDAALRSASGADLAGWDTRWRAYVASRPREPLPGLFGLSGAKGEGEKLRDLRDRRRLAELLLMRGHAQEAVKELDRIAMAASPSAPEAWDRATGDPSVRWLRARALEAVGRRGDGPALVSDPKQVLASYGPWWAIRGRWARLGGDEPTATASFIVEAVAADPFGSESACEAIDPAVTPSDPARKALCEAARAAGPEWEGD